MIGSTPPLAQAVADRHPDVVRAAEGFAFDHLDERLRPVSEAIHDAAMTAVSQMPAGERVDHELAIGLRKLLEAKDSIVRAAALGIRLG
jgi:hypothetical protein